VLVNPLYHGSSAWEGRVGEGRGWAKRRGKNRGGEEREE